MLGASGVMAKNSATSSSALPKWNTEWRTFSELGAWVRCDVCKRILELCPLGFNFLSAPKTEHHAAEQGSPVSHVRWVNRASRQIFTVPGLQRDFSPVCNKYLWNVLNLYFYKYRPNVTPHKHEGAVSGFHSGSPGRWFSGFPYLREHPELQRRYWGRPSHRPDSPRSSYWPAFWGWWLPSWAVQNWNELKEINCLRLLTR